MTGTYSKEHFLSSSFFHVIYKYTTWQTRDDKTNKETTLELDTKILRKIVQYLQ